MPCSHARWRRQLSLALFFSAALGMWVQKSPTASRALNASRMGADKLPSSMSGGSSRRERGSEHGSVRIRDPAASVGSGSPPPPPPPPSSPPLPLPLPSLPPPPLPPSPPPPPPSTATAVAPTLAPMLAPAAAHTAASPTAPTAVATSPASAPAAAATSACATTSACAARCAVHAPAHRPLCQCRGRRPAAVAFVGCHAPRPQRSRQEGPRQHRTLRRWQ